MGLPPNVRQFLELCTSHISYPTSQWLTEQAELGEHAEIMVGNTAYGWFLWVGWEERPNVPDDLWACAEYVRNLGYQYLLFDRDVDVVDALPTFDW